jgi:hypothetical protein
MHEKISKLLNNGDLLDAQQFLFNLLTPRINTEVISITSSGKLPGTNTAYDYHFNQNFNIGNVYKYLSAAAGGKTFQGGLTRNDAQALISKIVTMRNSESMKLYDPIYSMTNIEPHYVNRKLGQKDLTDMRHNLSDSFIDKVTAERLYGNEIFNNFMEWMSGKRAMTPAELIRLENEFLQYGISPSDMFLNQSYSIARDGSVLKAGDARIGHVLQGRSKLGDVESFGMPGHETKQKPTDWYRDQQNRRDPNKCKF